MALVYYSHGLGESLGDNLVTCSDLYLNDDVWYVHHDGDDTYDGRDRDKPVATLGQAVTNSGSGDIIVLMDGHAETLTAAVSIANRTVVGAGSSGGYPTVKLTNNQAAGSMLTANVASAYTQLCNVWLCEETQANASPKIAVNNGTYFRMRGCYVECGQYDDAAGLKVEQCSVLEIRNTTFISVATAVTAQPLTAIAQAAGNDWALFIGDGITFDNGTVGWSNYYAMDLTYAAASGEIIRVMLENISLLRGADIKLCSATEGHLNVGTAAGGARVDWSSACTGE